MTNGLNTARSTKSDTMIRSEVVAEESSGNIRRFYIGARNAMTRLFLSLSADSAPNPRRHTSEFTKFFQEKSEEIRGKCEEKSFFGGAEIQREAGDCILRHIVFRLL